MYSIHIFDTGNVISHEEMINLKITITITITIEIEIEILMIKFMLSNHHHQFQNLKFIWIFYELLYTQTQLYPLNGSEILDRQIANSNHQRCQLHKYMIIY